VPTEKAILEQPSILSGVRAIIIRETNMPFANKISG